MQENKEATSKYEVRERSTIGAAAATTAALLIATRALATSPAVAASTALETTDSRSPTFGS